MPLIDFLTVSQVRESIETDLTDEALSRIGDSEVAEIYKRYGLNSTATETYWGDGTNQITLERLPISITSITEIVGDVTTVLVAADYVQTGKVLYRQILGATNPRATWGNRTTIVFTPSDMVAQRTLVLLNLIKLAIQYSAASEEWVGDFRVKPLDWVDERNKLLRTLRTRSRLFW